MDTKPQYCPECKHRGDLHLPQAKKDGTKAVGVRYNRAGGCQHNRPNDEHTKLVQCECALEIAQSPYAAR